MARIQLGGLISNIRGSVAGSTYSQSRSGLILKSKACQPKANTIQRNLFLVHSRAVADEWSKASVTVKDYWRDFATFRNQIKGDAFPTLQTGYDLFRAINFYYLYHFGSVFTSPAFLSYDVDPVSVLTVDSSAPAKLILNRNLVSANEVLFIMMSMTVKNGIAPNKSALKLIGSLQTNTDEFAYDSAMLARFGQVPTVGDFVFVAVSVMSIASGFMYPFTIQRLEVI